MAYATLLKIFDVARNNGQVFCRRNGNQHGVKNIVVVTKSDLPRHKLAVVLSRSLRKRDDLTPKIMFEGLQVGFKRFFLFTFAQSINTEAKLCKTDGT